MSHLNVAAIQMVSGSQVSRNIDTMHKLVHQAAQQGAQWVLLPEYWCLMGKNEHDKCAIAEHLGDGGPLQNALSQAAKENQVVLFGGTIALKSQQANKVYNALLVYGKDGKLLNKYNKMHLFGFQKNEDYYAEADSIVAGSLIPHFEHEHWQVAQGICYDLRFPEFFRAQLPFDIMMLPAAFTYQTGKAHWLLLLRARAVENQCFVVAAAQGGKHDNGRRTFGHSVIINPWGEVMAQCETGEGVVQALLDKTELQTIRQQLPALQHRLLATHIQA